MISALKIKAERIELSGVASRMMFNAAKPGKAALNIPGRIAKYLETSLAMENVVNAPRVISICLPILTTSSSLVGSELEIDQVCSLLRGRSAGMHREPDIGLRQRRGVVGTVAGHGDEAPFRLFGANEVELVFRFRFRHEGIYSCLLGYGAGRHRVIAGDHDGANSHRAQLLCAFAEFLA